MRGVRPAAGGRLSPVPATAAQRGARCRAVPPRASRDAGTGTHDWSGAGLWVGPSGRAGREACGSTWTGMCSSAPFLPRGPRHALPPLVESSSTRSFLPHEPRARGQKRGPGCPSAAAHAHHHHHLSTQHILLFRLSRFHAGPPAGEQGGEIVKAPVGVEPSRRRRCAARDGTGRRHLRRSHAAPMRRLDLRCTARR